MRKPGDWMRMPDVYILEYISEEGASPPSELEDEDGADLFFSRSYLNTRCQDLEDKGFLLNIGNGMYQITDRGEDWLVGEFDAKGLDDPQETSA